MDAKKNFMKVFTKKYLKFCTSLAVIIFFSSNIFAAGGKISGKVKDSSTGEALPGVNIQVVDLNTGAASDIEGDYFILNISPGTYSVKASIIGYKTITKIGVEVSINHTTNIDFEMEETVLQIGEDVVVVAERPLVERDQTSTRHFVSSEEIATRPASQLNQILTTLPGIDANAQGELTVRRGSLDQVAFLIDGMRASNPLNYEPYTNINLSSIQELEIITGGFNAEYGQAQSGVFNIVTKDGSNKLTVYTEGRWTPPRKPHWGTAFYDYSTTRYWENTHARHLQWWIDNPNQWVDPNGISGSDPNSIWTPEQAYSNYLSTHQPLNDYTNESAYQGELAIGGPIILNDLFFFISGKYRQMPPVTGNSFRS
ncbi:MAG: TonB-dependent receptor, partial [Ignavibacteriaceae bacterium]